MQRVRDAGAQASSRSPRTRFPHPVFRSHAVPLAPRSLRDRSVTPETKSRAPAPSPPRKWRSHGLARSSSRAWASAATRCSGARVAARGVELPLREQGSRQRTWSAAPRSNSWRRESLVCHLRRAAPADSSLPCTQDWKPTSNARNTHVSKGAREMGQQCQDCCAAAVAVLVAAVWRSRQAITTLASRERRIVNQIGSGTGHAVGRSRTPHLAPSGCVPRLGQADPAAAGGRPSPPGARGAEAESRRQPWRLRNPWIVIRGGGSDRRGLTWAPGVCLQTTALSGHVGAAADVPDAESLWRHTWSACV